jgi:hypothetical protein
LKPRYLWLVPGLAIAIFANGQAAPLHGAGLAALIFFGIMPHATALPLVPRSDRVFNVLHHPALPAAVVVLGLVGIVPLIVLVGALAWLSHIVVDWALGDGVRNADGTRRAWLTWT